jgi:hypothetical protein
MLMDDKGRKRLGTLMLIQEKSHRQVAKAAGWDSHAMVGHLLKGRKHGVSSDSALALARYFGVPVHELFVTKLSDDTGQKVA